MILRERWNSKEMRTSSTHVNFLYAVIRVLVFTHLILDLGSWMLYDIRTCIKGWSSTAKRRGGGFFLLRT